MIEDLIQANERYAQTFDKGGLPTPPARRLAVVTCMDSRMLPSRFLGLEEGDAHIIRNAGGSAREALRSLVISQQLLGTNAVVVIHHTRCGSLTFENDDLHTKVREHLGADASHIDFLPFADLDKSVRDDVQFLKDSPLIAEDTLVWGFVYDVESGRLREVS
ncbi:MAG: beta-class carbonic anhydrase [Thermoleophilaceae bacterium]